MFNSYASGGRATASANNYLKINAISGTLIKNHAQSIFVYADRDSTLFDPTNPRFNFPKSVVEKVTKKYHDEYVPGYGWKYKSYEITEQRDAEVPCVVLQAMIIGDGLFLCEIVPTSQFFADESCYDGETGG